MPPMDWLSPNHWRSAVHSAFLPLGGRALPGHLSEEATPLRLLLHLLELAGLLEDGRADSAAIALTLGTEGSHPCYFCVSRAARPPLKSVAEQRLQISFASLQVFAMASSKLQQ